MNETKYTRKEYTQDIMIWVKGPDYEETGKMIKALPDDPPPCVICHPNSFRHCVSKELDCKAFRSYAGNGWVFAYGDPMIGASKHPIARKGKCKDDDEESD